MVLINKALDDDVAMLCDVSKQTYESLAHIDNKEEVIHNLRLELYGKQATLNDGSSEYNALEVEIRKWDDYLDELKRTGGSLRKHHSYRKKHNTKRKQHKKRQTRRYRKK